MSVLKGSRVQLKPIEKSNLYSLNKWKNAEEVYQNLQGAFCQFLRIFRKSGWTA